MLPTWLYLKSEANLWTVGFFKPDGTWESDSDHHSPKEAAERVHYLNGGGFVSLPLTPRP